MMHGHTSYSFQSVISLAHGIQCCPVSFARPPSLHCEEYVVSDCVEIVYQLPLLPYNIASATFEATIVQSVL